MPSDDGPHCPSAPRNAARATPTLDFMQYPFPETKRVLAHLETLPNVKGETKECITNLLNYRAVRTRAKLPRGTSAAVLVPLFVGRTGDLYVLLSRRSDSLKTFAGDTALPGGKLDVQDVTLEDTARREAFEEIGLPQDRVRMPLLCVMEPHLAKGEILVTPVVVLILDYGLQPNLNSAEVTSVFAQPLISFLLSTPYLSGGRTADPSKPYYSFTDFPWSHGGTIRLHRFLTGRENEGIKPVFGITAAILIKTATIGYRRMPGFEVQPPNAPTPAQQIAYALLTPANPLHIASRQEGIDTNKAAARLLRSSLVSNAAWTFGWRKRGTDWGKLVKSNMTADVSSSSRAGAAMVRERGSGSFRVTWDRNPGGDNPQKRVDEVKKVVQARVDNRRGEDTESDHALIEEYKQAARELKEDENSAERNPDLTPDIIEVLLDQTRDMVNERVEEVKDKEEKLSKASKTYLKVTKRVRKQLEEPRNENPKALSATTPGVSEKGTGVPQGNFKAGIETGEDGTRRGTIYVDDGEERDQGMEREKEGTQEGLEEMKEYIDPAKQATSRKRDAKL